MSDDVYFYNALRLDNTVGIYLASSSSPGRGVCIVAAVSETYPGSGTAVLGRLAKRVAQDRNN
jgi:hypothetical protein